MRQAEDLFSQFSRNAGGMDDWARKAPRRARAQAFAPAPPIEFPRAAELEGEDDATPRPWWKLL